MLQVSECIFSIGTKSQALKIFNKIACAPSEDADYRAVYLVIAALNRRKGNDQESIQLPNNFRSKTQNEKEGRT